MAQLHHIDGQYWILTTVAIGISFPERLPRITISMVGPFNSEDTALSLFHAELLPFIANKTKDYAL